MLTGILFFQSQTLCKLTSPLFGKRVIKYGTDRPTASCLRATQCVQHSGKSVCGLVFTCVAREKDQKPITGVK